MDEWLAYSAGAILEAWQRDLVPALLAGRAVRLTIDANAGLPLKIEAAQFYKDKHWPPAERAGRPPHQ
jgi:hypothetical protein